MSGDDEAGEILLAAEKLDEADQTLLEAIADLYDEVDPLPDGLVERIKFEITLDALRTEVATLTQLDLASSGARSAPGVTDSTEAVRTITFTTQSVTTMVMLSGQPGGLVRVDGWAVPGGVQAEVLLVDGSRRTEVDADGRFAFDGLPPGLAKLAVHTVDSAGEPHTVVSPTIEL